MKHIRLIVCSLVLSWSCSWAAVDTLISEVVAGMHTIPLLDGKSVFGDKVACVNQSFCLESIDEDTDRSYDCFLIFKRLFKKPIKKEGMFHTTYYTSKEILDVYKELAERSRRLNPDAVAFFKDLLTYGNMYQHPLPHLYMQPERAKVFEKIFKIGRLKPHDSMAKLQGIRDDLIAEEEARARAELPKPAPKQEEPAVRRRKFAADRHVDAMGCEDASSAKSPLLHQRIPVH